MQGRGRSFLGEIRIHLLTGCNSALLAIIPQHVGADVVAVEPRRYVRVSINKYLLEESRIRERFGQWSYWVGKQRPQVNLADTAILKDRTETVAAERANTSDLV